MCTKRRRLKNHSLCIDSVERTWLTQTEQGGQAVFILPNATSDRTITDTKKKNVQNALTK